MPFSRSVVARPKASRLLTSIISSWQCGRWATNARITDAAVTAKVSGLAASGRQKTLEPMTIADATAFGALFNLYPDLHTVRVTVQRAGLQPVAVDFSYDHRRR